MVTDVALCLRQTGFRFSGNAAPPSSAPQPPAFADIRSPPLDKSDAVIDANGTQRISPDFVVCCAQGDGLGPGESECEWLNNGAKAL